ncbi:MAG: hypothetical protein JRI59_00125 [Deltaproteobacteria bacterium]|nr:hypothetical protein [Deltaproteobacteria bacterium]
MEKVYLRPAIAGVLPREIAFQSSINFLGPADGVADDCGAASLSQSLLELHPQEKFW